MKRILSILLILTLIAALASCDNNDKTAGITDAQENLCNYGAGSDMCEDDNNFYFMHDSYIYVVNKASQKCVPLCNKPDCLHDKQNTADDSNTCNAFIRSNLDQLAYCDGKLYCQSYREKIDKDGYPISYFMLTKMNTDGTNREDIYTTTDFYIHNFKIHRGYIYAHIIKYDQSSEDDENDDYSKAELYRMPISGGEWEKLDIPYFGDEHRLILDYRLYGDYLYVISNYYDKDNPEAEYNAAIMYDLNKKKAKEITDNFNPKLNWVFTVMDGKIYYDNGGKVYTADPDGKNAKQVADLNKKVKGYKIFRVYNNDGENVYITAHRKEDSKDTRLVLLQKDGKVRSYKIPTKEIINKSDLISLKSGGNPDGQLFFSDHEDDYGEQYEDYYYLDKTKLGSNECVKHIYTRKFNP